MTQLSAATVEEVFRDCLFRDDEDMTDMVEVEGIVNRYGFHPGRLEGHREEITALLMELPDQFRQSKGGGYSFLGADLDRHGEQWTGFHRTMGELFALGMAIEKVKCPLPREWWAALPGSMPYYVVLDED